VFYHLKKEEQLNWNSAFALSTELHFKMFKNSGSEQWAAEQSTVNTGNRVVATKMVQCGQDAFIYCKDTGAVSNFVLIKIPFGRLIQTQNNLTYVQFKICWNIFASILKNFLTVPQLGMWRVRTTMTRRMSGFFHQKYPLDLPAIHTLNRFQKIKLIPWDIWIWRSFHEWSECEDITFVSS
jgi:hypothetical protein